MGKNNQIDVYDTEFGRIVYHIDYPTTNAVDYMQSNEDKTLVYTADSSGRILCWWGEDGRLMTEYEGHTNELCSFEIDKLGRVITAGCDGYCFIFSPDGKQMHTFVH